MNRAYKRTKEFLTDKLIKNLSEETEVRQRIINGQLTEKEKFFNLIRQLCENLYYHNPVDRSMLSDLLSFNIEKMDTGWFRVDNEFAKGQFINPNFIFKDCYCDTKQCHQTAYDFIVDHSLKDMKLMSGMVRPYQVGDGFLHSVCSFKNAEKEYIFDGAHFLLMDKQLYYDIFNFKEMQSLSRHTILKDRVLLSQKKLNPKTIVKNNTKYKLAKNFTAISKRFSGMGFIIYLYDREGYLLACQAPIEEFESKNNSALKELNEKIDETMGLGAYKF